MFALASCKDGLVRDHMDDMGYPTSWNLKFRRNLYDWEILEAEALLRKFCMEVLGGPSDTDKRIWKCNSKGTFFVKSFLLALEEDPPQFEVWKFFWKSPYLQSLISFYGWLIGANC